MSKNDGGTIDLDLDLAARYPHIKCAKYADLLDFHFAVDGSGPLANEWMDKPHRLVYRLTGMLSDLRDASRARDADVVALLNRASDLCLEVVKRGEHAAHNSANLRNDIDKHLQGARLAALLPFAGDKK